MLPPVRINELGTLIGWEQSRLSHQLRRMRGRVGGERVGQIEGIAVDVGRRRKGVQASADPDRDPGRPRACGAARRPLRLHPPRPDACRTAGHDPQTLDTIGQKFGVTRERIRQIEAKSLEKLRKMLESTDMATRANYTGN